MRLVLVTALIALAAAAPVAQTITTTGTDCLWIAFAGLFLPTLYFAYATFQQPDGKRYFHIITTMICAIASIAYFTMASGSGFIIRQCDRCKGFGQRLDGCHQGLERGLLWRR